MSDRAGFHPQALAGRQTEVLRKIAPILGGQSFYLAGGTALALQLGHRKSVDFDWFRHAEITSPEEILGPLQSAGIVLDVRHASPGTVHGAIQGVTTSFFSYHYPLVDPLVVWSEFSCPIASIPDIASMKLAALAQRGARKDFVDIYAICKTHEQLASLLDRFQVKYGTRDIAHVLVALNYFEDAEREPMPAMIWKDDWGMMKSAIRAWVKEYAG